MRDPKWLKISRARHQLKWLSHTFNEKVHWLCNSLHKWQHSWTMWQNATDTGSDRRLVVWFHCRWQSPVAIATDLSAGVYVTCRIDTRWWCSVAMVSIDNILQAKMANPKKWETAEVVKVVRCQIKSRPSSNPVNEKLNQPRHQCVQS